MPETGYFAVFLIGLLGGTHCVSMCGGIVGALTVQVRVPGGRPQWPLHLAYNFGRVATYTALGGLVGALGSVGMLYDGMLPVQMSLYVLANLMLVALGLYLTGFTRLLAPVERAGHVLWRRIQPATRRFLPARSVRQALPLGLLWGFIPCGLTYSILATALVTGSGARGAGLMLAFGLGTLPNLLLAGMLFKRFRDFTRNPKVRFASGLLVLGFGVFGLLHAPTLGGALWDGVVCVV
jgi:sulfite exporter TauE/SafE